MGRYFGREPRYSQQEAEVQAKEAIDAAVKKGRPPAEEWKGLGSRMGDINRELAARPPVDLPPPPPPRRAETEKTSAVNADRPRVVSQILRPRDAAAPAAPPAKRATGARAAAAKTPIKRSARAEPRADAAAKRPAAKKRPG